MSTQMYRSCEIVSRPGRLASGFILFACVVCFALVGCGDGSSAAKTAIKQANATNAQKLSNLYLQYQRLYKGNGPKDEAEFRTFISKVNSKVLERMGVDPNSLDELFVSERDNQELIIRYGVKGKTNDVGGVLPQPLVFEQEGDGGMRRVAFSGGTVEEVEEAEYQKLLEE